jgi:hypothetical protein
MRKGTTWRVMAADRFYGEFYEFYSVIQEYFRCSLVHTCIHSHMYTHTPDHSCPLIKTPYLRHNNASVTFTITSVNI